MLKQKCIFLNKKITTIKIRQCYAEFSLKLILYINVDPTFSM